MSAAHTPGKFWVETWLETSTPDELLEGAIYMQDDARHLYSAADHYRSTHGKEWIASRVQESAANSSRIARSAFNKATGSSA